MRRSAYAVAGALSLALVGQALLSGAASAAPNPISPGSRALTAIKSGAVSLGRDSAGHVRYVTARRGHPLAVPADAKARTFRDAGTSARANVTDFAPYFGIAASDLTQVSAIPSAGGAIVRFQQTHNGVPVIGGQLVVSDDASGNLLAINGGTDTAVAAVNTTTKITAAAAAATAIRATAAKAKVSAADLVASAPVLSVYDPKLLGAPDKLAPRSVYQVTVTSKTHAAVDQYVLVDAVRGGVALSFSQVDTFQNVPTSASVSSTTVGPATVYVPSSGVTVDVCDYGNHAHNDGIEVCPSQWASVIAPANLPSANIQAQNAYNAVGEVNDFYNTVLGRQGIDGNNMDVPVSVRYCQDNLAAGDCPWTNSYWDGDQIVFGDAFANAPDVVGHEYTHGVTQYTSGLLYYYQPGAINESMSDVMGKLFDQYSVLQNLPTHGLNNWIMGDGLQSIFQRDMSDPTKSTTDGLLDPQPGSTLSKWWSPVTWDDGGVHEDSGVGNHAAYLALAGGTYNGVTAGGMSGTALQKIEKTAAVWLGANELLTSAATYADLGNALNQSCTNLLNASAHGITVADCASVTGAVGATKMADWPVYEATIPQATQCGTGYSTVSAFSDNFNRAITDDGINVGDNWTTTGVSESAYIDNEAMPSVAAGNSLLIYGADSGNGAAHEQTAYTKNWTTLSSAHTSYLYFKHLDSFDWFNSAERNTTSATAYFEGMFIDIDINGDGKGFIPFTASSWTNGPTHTVYHSHYDSGIFYEDSAYSGKAFAGDSRGWTSSRATLASSLKGKQVRFRFRTESDDLAYWTPSYGVWLDDVAMNDCVIPPVAPGSVTAKGYNGSATLSWAASSVNGGDAIKSYSVYQQEVGGPTTSSRVALLASTARSYSFTGLKPGKDYIFKVRSLNTGGAYSGYTSFELYGANITATGSATAISGKLTKADDASALTTRKISLYFRATGTTTWTKLATQATTDSAGNYSFPIAPAASTDYYVEYSTGSATSMGTFSTTVTVVP